MGGGGVHGFGLRFLQFWVLLLMETTICIYIYISALNTDLQSSEFRASVSGSKFGIIAAKKEVYDCWNRGGGGGGAIPQIRCIFLGVPVVTIISSCGIFGPHILGNCHFNP